MNGPRFAATLTAALVLITGCASLSPYSEPPAVSVTSFSMAPADASSGPLIRVGLRVTNPNRNALPLVGMSYSVEIEQARILSGATAELPEVPAYGTADFTVDLSPDLIGGIRLLNNLMAGNRGSLDYRFSARLDVGRWRPDIRIDESGSFKLAATR